MNKSKIARIFAVLMCAVLMLSMTACKTTGDGILNTDALPTGEFPVTVGGIEIKNKPQSVVVLSASMADVVVAVGAETQLVAGSTDCTQVELAALDKVDANDMEAISSYSPDLILLDRDGEDKVAQLEGIAPVLILDDATSREDFERLYGELGTAFMGSGAGTDTGIKAARKIFTTLDDISRLTSSDKIYTSCYLYDVEGRAVTGEMFGSIVMEYSGLTNIFGMQREGNYDLDVLRLADPDFIFCAPGVEAQIMKNSKLKELQAVTNKKIYEFDEYYMDWQGRTVITAAIEMSSLAFPELMVEATPVPTDPTEEIESKVESEIKKEEEDSKTYETLKNGDNNVDVENMQKRLTELEYLNVEYDGHFGDITEAALKEFQKKNGLEENGVADSDTQKKLYSDAALKKSDPDATPVPEETPDEGTSQAEAE